ncbi:MAG: hypothetical protein Q9220_005019 [cf. Caloplaca sp. 1 TL-2023]
MTSMSTGILTVAFVSACGLARTGTELIAFRALQGVSLSLCLPSGVSILTKSFAPGRIRNVGFSFLGAGQVLGFCIGLVLGGLIIESTGWRVGYYICGGVHLLAFVSAIWALPQDRKRDAVSWQRLWNDIDWIGAAIASSCLGMFSYVLAIVTGSSSSIKDPLNATLMAVAAALIPIFAFWVGRQERLGKPALIPNSIWKIPAFTAVCLMVMVSWGVMNSMEFFVSLFLIIVDVFPVKTQALAGAVFNTVAQCGTSLGIATMSVVATNVTKGSKIANKHSPAALMEGYRAQFWFSFASVLLTCMIGVVGLRKAGKVGLKRD